MKTLQTRRQVMNLMAGAAIASASSLLPVVAGSRSAVAQAGDTQLVCNANDVQVRTEPGLDTEVIGSLNTDDVVNLIGAPEDVDGLVWLNVAQTQPIQQTGWVAAIFLDTPTDIDGWDVGARVYVNVPALNFRAEPGLESEVLLVVPEGSKAIIRWAPLQGEEHVWSGAMFHYIDGPIEGYFAAEYLAEDVQDLTDVSATPAGATPAPAMEPGAEDAPIEPVG